MSRRAVSLLLAAILLLSILNGCGDRESVSSAAGSFGSIPEETESIEAVTETEPETQTAEAPTTGSFSMAYNSTMGWDPYNCMGMENQAVMQLIYEGLFTMTPDFEAEPLLVSGYTVSEDGCVYTLELRDAVFSSGKALNADDVIYSMDKAKTSALYSARFEDIASYSAVGSSAVEIRLDDANDRLPCLLTFPIVPNFSSDESPPGTGPFARNGDVLTRNVNWWGGMENLGFQTVMLYSSYSAEDTRDNFEIDNVHFVYNNPSASTAATFHCDYELWNGRNTVMQYVGFNFSSGMFKDDTLRAAVTHAIDRVSIAESAYHNFAEAAVLPAPPASKVYFEDLAQKYNYTAPEDTLEELAESNSFYLPEELLKSAPEEDETLSEPDTTAALEDQETPETETPGEEMPNEQDEDDEDDDEDETEDVADDKTDAPTYNNITMLVRSGNLAREAAAQEVAKDLEEVGFTVTVQAYPDQTFIYMLNKGDWDIYYGEMYLKPDFDLRDLILPGGNSCYGWPGSNSKLVRLIYDAMENSGNRYDLYEYIMEGGYLCPVLFVNNAVFTTRGVFTGLDPAPGNLFYQISNIRVNNN